MRTRYANKVCERSSRYSLRSEKKTTNMLYSPKAKKKYALVLQAKRVAEKVRTRSKEISFLVFQPGSYIYIYISTYNEKSL